MIMNRSHGPEGRMTQKVASAEPALSHNGGQHRQWSEKIGLVGFLCSIQRKVLIDTVGKSTIPPEKWQTRDDQVQKK